MKLLYTFFLAITLSGCAVLGGAVDKAKENPRAAQLTVQYATVKVIENSGDITREDVLKRVSEARELVEGGPEVTLQRLAEEVRNNINWERLDSADQLLLNAVLAEAEARLRERIGEGIIEAEDRVALLTLFDWIEQAAVLASD